MKPGSSQFDSVKLHKDLRIVACWAMATHWSASVRKDPARWLRLVKVACFTFGVLALGYCVMAILEAAVTQTQARAALGSLRAQFAMAPGKSITTAPVPGSVVASLDSPRIGLSVMVLEGTDKRTLRRGAGHLPGSGLPGEDGNVVIAGHRDTFFRALRDVRIGDQLDLTSPEGRYRYQVIWSRVVPPNDTQELYPTSDAVLTLVTCYPFSYIGPAPERLLVRAKRVEAPAQ